MRLALKKRVGTLIEEAITEAKNLHKDSTERNQAIYGLVENLCSTQAEKTEALFQFRESLLLQPKVLRSYLQAVSSDDLHSAVLESKAALELGDRVGKEQLARLESLSNKPGGGSQAQALAKALIANEMSQKGQQDIAVKYLKKVALKKAADKLFLDGLRGNLVENLRSVF